ncbi:MAG: hypothetical protein AAF570_28180, partial [Bacteroidota bacterium]
MTNTCFFPLILLLFACFGHFSSLNAQITNVDAWSEQGQIWLKWTHPNPSQDQIGYRIYARQAGSGFSSDWNDWEEIGSVFQEDATGSRLHDFDPLITHERKLRYLAPGGIVTPLTEDERLFVITPHADRDLFFAIRRVYRVESGGDCTIQNETLPIGTDNRTGTALNFTFNAATDILPVLQKEATFETEVVEPDGSTRDTEFLYRIYAYWADGRFDHNDNRRGYPVMGNPTRNGVPYYFIVWLPENGVPNKYGAVHFLHGGQGKASKFRPGNAFGIDLVPENCLLIAHDDNNLNTLGSDCRVKARHTWWFGYSRDYDAFEKAPDNPFDLDTDTVVNYTQRRV